MADRDERVVPLEIGLPWPVDGVVPVALASEFHAIVLVDRGWAGLTSREMAVVRWRGARSVRFDPLSVESLHLHHLFAAGLADLRGAGEVVDSKWAEAERGRDADQRFRHPEMHGELRHFVMLFEDSVFECLAYDWSVELTADPPERVLPRLWPRLFPRPE